MNTPYPSGHVEYSFNMYVDHENTITCNVDDSRVKNIVLNKIAPDNPFDPKWRLVIVFFEVSSIEEVDKIGAEIKDHIFDLLSFKLIIKISDVRQTGHGVTPREGEGAQCHIIFPAITCSGVMKSGGRKLDQREINEIEQNLYNVNIAQLKSLVSVFSYAMRTDEPVVQFMMLYLILYEIYEDQSNIDRFIMKVAPNTVQEPSPHTKRPETIYTKLRNEITHRTSISPEKTRNGIINNLSELKEITHKAIALFYQN